MGGDVARHGQAGAAAAAAQAIAATSSDRGPSLDAILAIVATVLDAREVDLEVATAAGGRAVVRHPARSDVESARRAQATDTAPIEVALVAAGASQGRLVVRPRRPATEDDRLAVAILAPTVALAVATSNLATAATVLDEQLRLARAAEATFRRVLEGAPDAIVVVDGSGAIVMINAQTQRLFGYGREELLGRSVDLLVPERLRARHPGHRAAYGRSPRARAMGTGLELYGVRRDGTEFPVEISLSPLQTDEGVLVSSAIRDVTGRRRQEEALARAKVVADAANRELESFSYSVAHDLRAPLRGLIGFAQLVHDSYGDQLDDEGKDWLDEIVQNARTMSALIDALLSLARVGRGELRRETVDLSALVRAAAAVQQASAPDRAVELVVSDELTAVLDPDLARALVDNLVSNAFKFTGGVPHPRVEVGSTTVGRDRAFYVRDNGAGFDMAFAHKLFGSFQRLHGSDEFPGTGIGLATGQRIVRRHGGRVWAEGTVGGGATFYFTVGSEDGSEP